MNLANPCVGCRFAQPRAPSEQRGLHSTCCMTMTAEPGMFMICIIDVLIPIITATISCFTTKTIIAVF